MDAEGKPVVMSRLVRREEADRDFDIEFWQRAGHEAIFKAAWELVETAVLLKGGDPNQLRLQRSVARLRKRPIPRRGRIRRDGV